MSKFEKALLRLRQNPKNVRYEEVEKHLVAPGFCDAPGRWQPCYLHDSRPTSAHRTHQETISQTNLCQVAPGAIG